MPAEQVLIDEMPRDATISLATEDLTIRERAFVVEYLNCWNPATAAIRAGFSPKSARAYGYQLLKKPVIAEAVSGFVKARVASAGMVIDRLVEQATGDMGDFLTLAPNGKTAHVDLAKALRDGKTHLIKRVRETTRSVEVELYDAQGALSLLARHLGMLNDKVNVSVDWRNEVSQAGLNPDDVREELKAALKARFLLAADAANAAVDEAVELQPGE